jgi:hypothetical protein
MCFARSTIPLFCYSDDTVRRVETQQSVSLAAVSLFVGFGLIRVELRVLLREPRRTRKSQVARWGLSKIIALPIRATLVSFGSAV